MKKEQKTKKKKRKRRAGKERKQFGKQARDQKRGAGLTFEQQKNLVLLELQ